MRFKIEKNGKNKRNEEKNETHHLFFFFFSFFDFDVLLPINLLLKRKVIWITESGSKCLVYNLIVGNNGKNSHFIEQRYAQRVQKVQSKLIQCPLNKNLIH